LNSRSYLQTLFLNLQIIFIHQKINKMQILAIDKIAEGVTAQILEPHLSQELAATINLI